MKKHSLILSLACAGILSAPAFAVGTAKPNADEILRTTTSKIAAAKQLEFHAYREIDPGLLQGRDLPEKSNLDVYVSRPNEIAARSVSKERTMHFIADGKTLTIYNETKKHYSQVPMRTTIDGLVERLDKEYGFVPPLADFAVNDPYKEIRQQARGIAYLGREKLSGGFLGLGSVECHHFALKGKEADAQLWITVADQLPRKLIATFHVDHRSQVRIDFSKWNLAPSAPASTFAFSPPKGTQKIEMWTTAQMKAVAGKH